MYCLQFFAQYRGKEGQMGVRAPGRKPWERINTLYSHLKTRNLDQTVWLKMCIFWKKAIKSPQRRGSAPNLHWPPEAGAEPPDSRFVFKTNDFNAHSSFCFNIRLHLTPSRSYQSNTFSKDMSKNDNILSFEQVICSGVTRKRANRGHVPCAQVMGMHQHTLQ